MSLPGRHEEGPATPPGSPLQGGVAGHSAGPGVVVFAPNLSPWTRDPVDRRFVARELSQVAAGAPEDAARVLRELAAALESGGPVVADAGGLDAGQRERVGAVLMAAVEDAVAAGYRVAGTPVLRVACEWDWWLRHGPA
jgi:hypothetical protein